MTHPVDKTVGKRIRDLRHKHGMTQVELADLVSVKFQQIQKYETGMNRVSASRLYEIADALKVEPGYFFPTPGSTPDQTEDAFTKEHFELIKAFDALHPVQRSNLLLTARNMNMQVAA